MEVGHGIQKGVIVPCVLEDSRRASWFGNDRWLLFCHMDVATVKGQVSTRGWIEVVDSLNEALGIYGGRRRRVSETRVAARDDRVRIEDLSSTGAVLIHIEYFEDNT